MDVDFCQQCGTKLPGRSLACPQCKRLVYSSELQELSERAAAAFGVGNFEEARDLYTQMLSRLPQESSQYRAVLVKLQALPPPPKKDNAQDQGWKKLVGSLGVVGAMLWKFKAFALILATKGKFLLLGLTKIKTLFSMFAAAGVYWALYGWRFAVGLIVSIYIHEMGHMWAFHRFGIPASAPMFIPGLGAFIRAKAAILDPKEDARIGLGGPWWGLGAAIGFEAGAQLSGYRWMSAVAHLGAVINLFNLLPVFFLDGSHAYKVLGRRQRGMLLATMLLFWYLTGETMFFLVSLGAAYRMFTKDLPLDDDDSVFYQFIALLAAFGFLSMISATALGA